MLENYVRRCLSFLLAMVMVFSMIPTQAFATDLEEHDHDYSDETVTVPEGESLSEEVEEETPVALMAEGPSEEDTSTESPADEIRREVSEYIEKYQLSADMPDSVLADAYIRLNGDQAMAAWYEAEAIREKGEKLPAEEIKKLNGETNSKLAARFYNVMVKLNFPMPLRVYEPVTNVSVNVEDATSESMEEGIVTVAVTGKSGGCGGSATIATITIYNDSSETANVTFDWAKTESNASASGSVTINSEDRGAASGSESFVLDANTSVEIKLSSPEGNSTTTLTLSNFAFEALESEYNVTFAYDETRGTVTVGGETAANGSVKAVSIEGVEVVATPGSGVAFLGWIDEEYNLLSRDTTFTLQPVAETTVRPVFVVDGDSPWWMIGPTTSATYKDGLLGTTATYYTVSGTHLYDDLEAAAAEAETSASSKTIVLMNSGTLTGNYTIPADVTLLIPFDDANTLYTKTPCSTGTYAEPTAYRTLTLANGASLTINGAMSLSAKHRYAAGSQLNGGSPTGAVSFVKMQDSSNITVNSGGVLYAYGFVTGSGSVTVNSGGSVYENFQIMDFRGGTQSTGMSNGVFPLSQYYVQNIEVPLTLYSGATEYSFTTIYMSSAAFGSSVAFIAGKNAMFNLTSGYVTKRYDGTTDRLMVEAHGDLTLSPISLSVGISSINSRNYDLGINGNITVRVSDNSTITLGQDVAFLPGSQIIVDEGSVCKLGSGINVYIYDADEWGNFCGPNDKIFIPVTYAPGRTYNRTVADLVDASIEINGTVDASQGYVYTTSGGANIFSSGSGVAKLYPGTQKVTHQLLQVSGTYAEIPLTTTKLKNADGTYVQLPEGGIAITYRYTDGVWIVDCGNDHQYELISDTATCTEDGKKTYVCKACQEPFEENSPAKDHAYEGVVTAPTCEEQGYTTYTCKHDSSHTYVADYVNALDHAWDEGAVTTDPTCEEKGIKTFTCKHDSSHTYTEDVDALNHDYEAVVTAPTCVAQGYTTYTCKHDSSHTYMADYVDALGHDYEAVVTPPTCATQGYTTYTCKNDSSHTYETDYVNALGHAWDDGVVTVEPGCITEGMAVYKCGSCSETKTEKIEAKGHTYASVVTAPTCEARGYTTYTCTCGDSYVDDYVDALNHAWDEGTVTTDPTCEGKGIKTFTCQNDNSHTYTEEVEALGHDYETVVTAPTCEEQGYTTYTCKHDSNHTYVADYVSALDHAWDEGAVTTDPTCEEKGIKTFTCKHDSRHTKTEEISALGHDYDDGVVTTAATCTTEGIKTFTCKNDSSHTYTETVKALGHDWDEGVYKEGEEPTCTESGVSIFTCKAVNCGEKKEEPVAELGHDMVHQTIQGATCTEPGESAGSKCSRCDYAEDITVIPALGHDWDEGTVITHPTCEDKGSKAYICKRDGSHTKTEEIAALDHAWDEGTVTTDPTCEEKGIKTFICQNDNSHTYTEDVDALNHDYEAVVKAPTCATQGYTTYTCKNDSNHTYVADYVDALGHDYEAVVTAPTCEEQGYTTYTCKNDSNHTYVADYVNALDHAWDEGTVTTDPTCEGKGVRAYTCKHDSSHTKTEEIAALGHDYDEGVVTLAPTCTTAGVKTFTCKNDSSHTYTETVKALGHDYEAVVTPPACGTQGYTTYTCKHDSKHTYETDYVNALDHAWDEGTVTTDPTCEKKGIKTFTCKHDNRHTKTEEIAALDHDYEAVVTAPTCEEQGYTTHTCKHDSGHTYVTDYVDAIGHDYDEGVVTTDSTCTTEGTKTFTCQNDKAHTYTEAIAALGHTEIDDAAVEPNCTENGLTEGKHCERCGEIFVAQQEIAALGHDMAEKTCLLYATCKREGCGYEDKEGGKLEHTPVEEEELPAMCETPGHTEGTQCSVCGTVLNGMFELEALGHDVIQVPAKNPTFGNVGWNDYEKCSRCTYSTYEEIPALPEQSISSYEEFVTSLALLEEMANVYVADYPGKDPLALIIKYIRTGVDRYNSGSWGIMAGSEDAEFAEFVRQAEDMVNSSAGMTEETMIKVVALKNIKNFTLPNGDGVDFGHMFGTMDITYHNKTSENHADVGGWAGDLVDLLSTADRHGVTGTVEEMTKEISDKYLNHAITGESDQFSHTDMYGDLDGYYIMQTVYARGYEKGALTAIMEEYFTERLTDEYRAEYFLKNRLDGVSTRNAVRDAVYAEYIGNKVVSTLEGTRDFISGNDTIAQLRIACCYAFADYLCQLGGDYVAVPDNPYYTVFSSDFSTLAPGITQEIKMATSADNKQMVFYIATADLNRSDVDVYANYNKNDPSLGWAMSRVQDQAQAAQDRYGDPESPDYIKNYNVIASINADGFNMSTGEPGGLLVMHGKEWHAVDGNGFFGILKNGTAVIGSQADYNAMKDQVQEGVGGFGTMLVKDGKVCISRSDDYYSSRASRTAVGITRSGKVVFMVLDGRQEPVSCGGSMEEIAQIMLEAGCYTAINLDGGGSTTYVAKPEGEDALRVVSSPSDGFARSVSTSLMMVSTAPSSTAFDHAILESEYDYLTVNSSVQMTAKGVSATGNEAEIPEGAYWAVDDTRWGSITENGLFTGRRNGSVKVNLMLGDVVLGSKTMNMVSPDNIYFTRETMNAVYGAATEMPVKVVYQGKPVAINPADVAFALSNENAGTFNGFNFTANAESGLKSVKVTASLTVNPSKSAVLTVSLFKQGEMSFDFEQATGGDRMLAWDRQVSNATTDDTMVYEIVDPTKDMVTSYIFAIDMTQIPMPAKLEELTYMLPGADTSNASAWNFLLQLAERVSVLTEVRPVLHFDPNYELDYSELKVVCEYFNLTDTIYDEEANTLTLVLNWKDQSKAIDPETADALCLLSGIKLTPKEDAAWDSRDRLTLVNTGEIGYNIFLRANALYTFASKPENQEIYGLLPFENPDVIIGGATEKGGSFSDIYKTFADTYTLICALKNGWVGADGGYAYYKNGEMYTGIREVDGYYYDFGENGICIGQQKYNGLFQENGKTRYAKFGELVKDAWITDGKNRYCFNENGYGYDGKVVVDEVEMIFENGKLIGGYSGFVKKTNGKTYHYQNGVMTLGWLEIDGYYYHFDTGTGVMNTGTKVLPDAEAKSKNAYYDFAPDGKLLRGYFNPAGYYYWAGLPKTFSWVKNGYDSDPEAWYATNSHGHYVTDPSGKEVFSLTLDGVTYKAVKIAVDNVVYTFNNTNGKLLLGSIVVNKDGTRAYMWAGKPSTDGWFELEGYTYYAQEDGTLATGSTTIDGKTYMFDGNGRLVTEGVIIVAMMSEDDTVMQVKTTGTEKKLTGLEVFIWPENTNQNETMRSFKAQKNKSGEWVVDVPMCLYNHAGRYILHAYASEAQKNPYFLISTTVKVDTPVDHIPGRVENINATNSICTVGGKYTRVEYCALCEKEISREVIQLAPGAHKAGAAVEENRKEATCLAEGSYDSVVYCEVCDIELTREKVALPVGEHTYDDIWDEVCNVCDEVHELEIETTPMYRMYNPNSGEHFYTGSIEEREDLVAVGWKYEGIAWYAPVSLGEPVYRLYNPNNGDHHYTMSVTERDNLAAVGWRYEGVAWNAAAPNAHPQYRLYNPNADCGSHHYTGSTDERDWLVSLGWIYEGIGWHGLPTWVQFED